MTASVRVGRGGLLAIMVVLLTATVQADMISFERITDNASIDIADQLKVELTGVDANHVQFKFLNSAEIMSSIVSIYFDDGGSGLADVLLMFTEIADDGTLFLADGNPGDLPGGNSLTPRFDADWTFTAANQPPTRITNGVDQDADSVGITFELAGGVTYADLVNAINDGALRIGLHVQAINDEFNFDQSDSFVNDGEVFQPPVPEPATMLLVGTGVIGLAGIIRRRQIK